METNLQGQIRELIDRGARPVSLQEISQRHAPAARREAGRHRTVITLTASGVAAAGCAAGLAIAFASPAQAPPAAQATPSGQASPSGQGSAFLTAATVRHMASASSAALTNSGQERISYRSVKNGTVTSAGTDTVTYSGSDWNYAVHQTVPAYPDGSVRAVHGQYYLKGDPASPWLHELGEDTSPHFPEAATLVRLLSPAANFQNAGTDVIGGLRLTHLHATRLSGLPDDPTLARYANLVSKSGSLGTAAPGTLTGLDVWADSRGVVHQMKIQLEGGAGQTTVTVTFTDSGQPQAITAPATSNPAPAS
ncbi:MAG: hypothetical protein ACRDNO_14275 [Trebonia sp.]